jgi:hypothetical protein
MNPSCIYHTYASVPSSSAFCVFFLGLGWVHLASLSQQDGTSSTTDVSQPEVFLNTPADETGSWSFWKLLAMWISCDASDGLAEHWMDNHVGSFPDFRTCLYTQQASCRATGISMSMEESTTRRAALGAILAGALAPGKQIFCKGSWRICRQGWAMHIYILKVLL